MNATLNVLDGDSSEEDEAIEIGSVKISASATSTNLQQEEENSTKSARPVLLQLPDDEEDEEDEDAPLPSSVQLNDGFQEPSEPMAAIQSEECIEALQAVESDCWDINSWILFIDEVESGRGGTITVPDAYSRFLDKFPRAAKQWKASAEYHVQHEEYALAEETYSKCLMKCRSVDLWQSYIHMIQQQKAKVEGGQKLIESAFEKAIDNVGMSIVSNPLWVAYIEFIKSWPDSDAGKKLGSTYFHSSSFLNHRVSRHSISAFQSLE
jgi:hypothetical protein